jgi:hypothetical protein
LNKRIKFSIGIIFVLIGIIIMGYLFRLDRFGSSKISWVDCIKINNSIYYSSYVREIVEGTLIDEKIGEVRFNISEKVTNDRYRFRNGDATFLKEKTEIYSLKTEDKAIAVKIDEAYFIYKIDDKQG